MTVKVLGLDTALQGKVRAKHKPTTRARIARDKARVALLRRLKPVAGTMRLGSVYQVGAVVQATFGAELHGLSPLQATNLRYQKLALDGLLLPGVSVAEQCALLPPQYDPALRPSFAPLER